MQVFTLFSLLLLFAFSTTAQETLPLIINYAPNEVVIKINDAQVVNLAKEDQPYIVQVPVGTAKVEAWTEGFEIHEFTTEVSADAVNTVNVRLQRLKPEFQLYRENLATYNRIRLRNNIMVGGSALLTAAAGGAFLASNSRNDEKIEQLDRLKGKYESALTTEELEAARANYQLELDEYKNRNNFGYILTGTAAAAWAMTYLYLRKDKDKVREKPVYNGTNPFVFQNIDRKKYRIVPCINGVVFQF